MQAMAQFVQTVHGCNLAMPHALPVHRDRPVVVAFLLISTFKNLRKPKLAIFIGRGTRTCQCTRTPLDKMMRAPPRHGVPHL